MMSLTLLLVIIVALFGLAYLTKRRFGVLGLALAAGSLLSTNWAGTLTPFIEQQGVVIVAPPLASLVESMLILAPPLLLLFSGPTYERPGLRVLGAIGFAFLAVSFLTDPLGESLRLDGIGLQVYAFLYNYQSIIIVIGLIAAIVDLLFTRKKLRKGK